MHIVNDRPGIAIRVTKTSNEDLFTIVEAVNQYVRDKQVPEGYELASWNDISLDVHDRIDLLTRNGLQGLLLVFAILALFLDLRLAFWVAMGIPVSILGAGFVLLFTDNTLNMLTMFAFLMALGIVVDDAIVIGENIYTKRLEGMRFVPAAIEGTVEVFPSVFASVATTVIAFLPLMFVSGVMGKFIAVMPLAVIAMLTISLLESTFILPAHLAHENNLFLRIVSLCLYIFKPLVWVHSVISHWASDQLERFVERVYVPILRWSLSNKMIVISMAVSVAISLTGLVIGGIVPAAFFPEMDSSEIHATLAFPDGTSSDYARLGALSLQQAVREVERKHVAAGGKPFIKNIYQRIGEVGNPMQGPTGVTNGSHVSSVEVQLFRSNERDITNQKVIQLWRENVPDIAGKEVLKFGSDSMGPGGNTIEFKLLANEKDAVYLDEVADACKQRLAEIEGVIDIEDDSRIGKWELTLRLNDLGKTLGLDENSLANTIRAVYFGEEVMRLQRGRHEVKLLVRYPKSERAGMEDFENIRIRDGQGMEWPLPEVAEISFHRASSELNRLNQKRCITVVADVDDETGDAVKINLDLRSEIVPAVLADFKSRRGINIGVNWEGEQAETLESFVSMFAGFAIALLCMFVLLTLEFRSTVQPLIIMAIIPFGWLGAIIGHGLLGLPLTMFSFFGLVALTGVVVNDSIVLVDFINRRVRSGMPLNQALMSAGQRRFRPILLTSATTVAGLFPMMFETSLQAQVLIPMAVSLIFGLMTGTALILLLVPIFYDWYGTALMAFGIPIDRSPYDEASHSHDRTAESWSEPASSPA
jgi:multidrug efflux pump subunit AcrB